MFNAVGRGEQMYSILQYGAAGLVVIMFVVLVGLLRAEQTRSKIRPEFLRVVYVAMALSVVLVLIALGSDFLKSRYALEPIQDQLNKVQQQLVKANTDLQTKEQAIADLTAKVQDGERMRAEVKGELMGLQRVEDVKTAFVLGDSVPNGQGKQVLLSMVNPICKAIQDLKATLGERPTPEACADVEKAIRKQP